MAGRRQKFAALTTYLEAVAQEFRDGREKPLHMTFREIEALGVTLPPSAYKHKAWWSNRNHERPWTRAGFRPREINLERQSATFRYAAADHTPVGKARKHASRVEKKRAEIEEAMKQADRTTLPFLRRSFKHRAEQAAEELKALEATAPTGMADARRGFNASQKCHPAFGSMRGLLRVVAGTDLTEPAADPKSWKPR